MTGAPAVIAFENVEKSFSTPHGAVSVLRGFNLTLAERDFVALTGPSGSGKSTCLHLAALLDRPTTGKVLLDGMDTSGAADTELCALRARKVGMVFQKYCLLPHRSVFENVLFRFRYVQCSRAEARQRAAGVLATMNLSALADRRAQVLSGGEMQRVAIARAVALEPRVLIADEPTGNLDRASATAVMDCFAALNEQGITILIATHNETLLADCTRHVRLDRGAVVEEALA